MMRKKHVLEEHRLLYWESRTAPDLLLQHFNSHDDMSNELPGVGIIKTARITQLCNLTNIVQQRAAHQEVAIDTCIACTHILGQTRNAQRVFQQSPKIHMV